MAVKIQIANGVQKIVLPVTPESFEVRDNWANEELNINELGLITLIRKRGLRSITISSFFPVIRYSFTVPGSTMADPWSLIRKLSDWRGTVLTLFITGADSWPCVIDGDFTYGEKDATGDVYYTLTLKEYKRTSSTRTENGTVFDRFPYTTKAEDTLYKISWNVIGSALIANELYEQNKAVLERAFDFYLQTHSVSEGNAYKALAVVNRPLPGGLVLTYGGNP